MCNNRELTVLCRKILVILEFLLFLFVKKSRNLVRIDLKVSNSSKGVITYYYFNFFLIVKITFSQTIVSWIVLGKLIEPVASFYYAAKIYLTGDTFLLWVDGAEFGHNCNLFNYRKTVNISLPYTKSLKKFLTYTVKLRK